MAKMDNIFATLNNVSIFGHDTSYKPTKAILKFRTAFLLLVMDLYLLRLWSVCSLRIGVIFLVNICVVALACGQTASLSGHVKNGESGESLSGAVVRVNSFESRVRPRIVMDSIP